jgi:PAS domain S-box-containing protein
MQACSATATRARWAGRYATSGRKYSELGPLNEAILRGERGSFFADDHRWLIHRYGVPEEAHFTLSFSPISDTSSPSGIGGVLATAFEITDRVRNEQTLRVLTDEVQQRTRERDRIWAVSEDLLGVANFEGYFLSVNPAWTNLLSWTEDEIKALHVNELRHPDDAAAAIAARSRLAQGIPTVRVENRLRHRDGSWRWISWTMTADSGLIYVSGRHITSEKQAAVALRESDRQFRSLVAGVTDYALYMLDPNGVVSSWNAGAERIKGYSEDEIIGRHFSQFYTPEDCKAGLPNRSLAIAAATGRFEAEAWRMRKGGALFWANVVIDAIHDESGRLIGFAKITRDITERRNAQEALERAHQQLAQAQKMEALGQLTGGVAHDFNNLLMVVSGQAQVLMRRLKDQKEIRSLEAILTAASRGEALTRQLLTFSRRQPQNPRTVQLSQTIAAFRDVLASSASGQNRPSHRDRQGRLARFDRHPRI